MTKIFSVPAIAGALLLGMATAAFAATNGEFDNMCAEGLALHKEIKTDCSINASLKGKMYCFGNEQAKTDFMKIPTPISPRHSLTTRLSIPAKARSPLQANDRDREKSEAKPSSKKNPVS